MYCKRCGMDSENTDVCDWCKQPMAPAGSQPAAERPAETPLESEAPAEAPSADVAAYVDDAEARPRATAPPPAAAGAEASDGVRFALAIGAGLILGLISMLLAYLILGEAPTRLYAGILRIPGGGGFSTALMGGALFGAIMGVLLGGLLCLTHLGPFVGVPIGAVLGYVIIFAVPFSYVGLVSGAIIGFVVGLAGNWRYKKRVSV